MKIERSSVELIDFMGTDLSVVNAARVSFHKESRWVYGEFTAEDGGHFPRLLSKADNKLISYLAEHKHFSPFNHCFASVRVKAPIYVARQLVKHEYMPWNEVSRRYVDSEPSYGQMIFRFKADNVKQGSGGELPEIEQREAQEVFWEAIENSHRAYMKLLDLGVCPEQARAVTALNTNTEWIWSGSLKAFAKMLQLRLDGHTQGETRAIAEDVLSVLIPLFPVSLPALLKAEL